MALVGADDTEETLPKELGADDSDVALVAVAILVCVLAPLAEEFFFRGYFFTALRSWRGMWPAAIITGMVFGAIHAGSSDPAFLLPLAALGTGLCLLYVRTGSLYPCVAAHALNNSIAFGVSQDWGWEILPVTVARARDARRDPHGRAQGQRPAARVGGVGARMSLRSGSRRSMHVMRRKAPALVVLAVLALPGAAGAQAPVPAPAPAPDAVPEQQPAERPRRAGSSCGSSASAAAASSRGPAGSCAGRCARTSRASA